MAIYINIPNPINMGTTPVATPKTVLYTIQNPSDSSAPLQIYSITFSDPEFTTTYPIGSIAPGQQATLNLTFTPSGSPGSPITVVATVDSNAITPSITFQATAQVIAGTVPNIKTLDTGSTHYGTSNFGVIKDGIAATPSAPINIISTVSGELPRIVSIVADANDGFSVSNISETLPYTYTSNTDIVSFIIGLTPEAVGQQFFPQAVTITYDAGTGPQYTYNHTATYQGYLIVPAYILGNTVQAMLVAFEASGGGVVLMQVNPLDLNCEENAYIKQQLDFDEPGQVKNVERYLIRYERLGQTSISVGVSANSPANQPPITQIVMTSTSTDGTIDQLLVDGSIAAEVLQLEIQRLAGQGPLSITLYQPYIDVRGEKIEAT